MPHFQSSNQPIIQTIFYPGTTCKPLLFGDRFQSGVILEKLKHLARLGVASGFAFAVDEGVIDGDFKFAAIRRHQYELADVGLELRQNIVRQTDGAWGVVSHRTVNNGHPMLLHLSSPFIVASWI